MSPTNNTPIAIMEEPKGLGFGSLPRRALPGPPVGDALFHGPFTGTWWQCLLTSGAVPLTSFRSAITGGGGGVTPFFLIARYGTRLCRLSSSSTTSVSAFWLPFVVPSAAYGVSACLMRPRPPPGPGPVASLLLANAASRPTLPAYNPHFAPQRTTGPGPQQRLFQNDAVLSVRCYGDPECVSTATSISSFATVHSALYANQLDLGYAAKVPCGLEAQKFPANYAFRKIRTTKSWSNCTPHGLFAITPAGSIRAALPRQGFRRLSTVACGFRPSPSKTS